MWTRGKDKQNEGKFSYTLYSLTGETVKTVGSFDTAQDADRAAEIAQRIDLFGDKARMPLDDMLATMSDDELLKELLA